MTAVITGDEQPPQLNNQSAAHILIRSHAFLVSKVCDKLTQKRERSKNK
ncbi:MAG: hypothetical protein ACT6QU_02030 [Aliihoeflea sp.]